MILDSSAVCAVAFDEPQGAAVLERIEAAEHLRMSAATMVELAAVLARSGRPEVGRRAERLLAAWDVDIVPFDAAQVQVASQAYREYGRGSGHRAALNLGDCYAYALSATAGEPLLFVGDDFPHTDVEVALR
ncbi:MAG: VapC toxin family PIN domain ribonuclease [Actinobacteria bacterium HGW-Actinobacteria-4]|nr:MAG: VapC toxin family PIN domain ribonuclease [Actinobacteria bacterium HGW-Actinobacteria-4]